jgi:predicted permease
VLLAFAGGALGLAIAVALNRIFISKLSNQLPRADQIHLDASVLAFTALVSLLASVLFGITPAIQSARSDLNKELKEGARGNTSRHGFQRALVVVEVALALVLTASAGLMIRTMSHLWSVNPGFDPQNVLTLGIAGSPAVHGAPAAVRNGFTQTMDQMRTVPGVKAVSVMFGGTPMNGDSELPYWIEGRPKPEQSQMDLALFYGVDADYFNVMRIPLLRGRLLSDVDDEKASCSVDIDEDFASRNFPNQDPMGQHVNLELIGMKCAIVGAVGHVKHWGLDADATSKVHSQIYIAYRQFPDSVMDLASTGSDFLIRTASDPYSAVPALKRAITAINGKMVGFGEESMQDVIKDSLAARRFTRLLLGTFAVLALVLAGVGIYGVISYAVSQSTHDIGVRMALGADTGTVLGMVLKDAMRMAFIGIVIGAAAAFAVTRVMKSLLFGVSAADPLTFIAVAMLLSLVALLASYIPAGRATKVDPIIALRYE